MAHRYGLDGMTRFEVTAVHVDGDRWSVQTADGDRESFDFVVCATGILHHPRLPDLPGLGEFGGAAFHSAR
ncbi:hypothetical protein ACFVAV_12205 [Nocardia sp. NPDC057663]|uniref:hypothetical protein n=1 Tax=Nocardia sp. NPDC057663 TaxID=3346201 RepID=UPI00366F6E71